MLWQEQAQQRLRARVRVKTLAMWTDQGRLGQELCKVMLLYSWSGHGRELHAECTFPYLILQNFTFADLQLWILIIGVLPDND